MNKRTSKVKGPLVKTALCISFVLFLMSGSQVFATEGGLGPYPDGIDDTFLGCCPPPGLYFLNYFLYYNIKDYKDARISGTPGANGMAIKETPLGTPRIHGTSFVDALRLVYVTKKKVLGGDFLMHIIQPVQYLKLEGSAGPIDDLFADTTNKKTGLKNTVVAPGIAWHLSKNFHMIGAMDIVMPTGAWSQEDAANTGNHYWTFMPLLALTYITDGGFEVGAKLMWDINTTNQTTGYYSGQAFHSDYIVAQKVGAWNVGLTGYYFQQMENDSIRGEWSQFDGNKGRAFAFGPLFQYNYKNMFFKVKAEFETYVKNRPEGERYWFNFLYAF